jgi:sporulation protein YlmC with PRC-barrel domain
MKTIVTAVSLAVLMTVPAIAQDAAQRAQDAPAIETVEKNSAAAFSGDVSAKELLSKNVVNAANESIGDINDILIDREGKVVAVIVGVGGFLGMGEKDVALPYDQLTFSTDTNNNSLIVGTNATKESLETAPEYIKLGDRS